MCEAATAIALTSAALSAAGTAYSANQQQQAAKAANRAEQDRAAASNLIRTQERDRQRRMADEAWGNWQDQLGTRGADVQGDVQGQGAAEMLDTTQRVVEQSGTDMGLLPGQTGDSVAQVFTEDVARRGVERSREAKARINALAQLSGYDRANGFNRITGARFNADQSLLGGMQQTSAAIAARGGVMPEAESGFTPSPYGQIASGLGNMGLQYAGRSGAGNSLIDAFVPPRQGGIKAPETYGAGG
jgi:hypothetical protein